MATKPRIQTLDVPGSDSRIGQLLRAAGKLTPEGIDAVLRLQQGEGLRFGEAALQLGLVKQDDVARALAGQLEEHGLKRHKAPGVEPGSALYDSYSTETEVFRSVGRQLMSQWAGGGRHILAVVSPRHNDGRSFVASRLALGFARFGRRTLLIDGDLRRPGLPSPFDVTVQNPGLTDVLLGNARDEKALRMVDHEHLFVLPSGPKLADPLRFLSRECLHDRLNGIVQQFEVVLVDTPAASEGPDFQALCAWSGAALMVARKGRTRFAEAEFIRKALGTVRCSLLGAVLNEH